GEAAESICAHDETSPSLTGHPKENRQHNGAKNYQRQGESQANLQPLKKRTPSVVFVSVWRDVRQRRVATGCTCCLQPTALLTVFSTCVVHGAQGSAELLMQI